MFTFLKACCSIKTVLDYHQNTNVLWLCVWHTSFHRCLLAWKSMLSSKKDWFNKSWVHLDNIKWKTTTDITIMIQMIASKLLNFYLLTGGSARLAWVLVLWKHYQSNLIFSGRVSKASTRKARKTFKGQTREASLKGKAQYSSPLCTNKFESAQIDIGNIIYLFIKQATLMRRSTILSLPLQSVFPGQTLKIFCCTASEEKSYLTLTHNP